jgi:hypothetical protein
MSWAKALGHDDVAELLSSTLEEEKAADEKLSELAEAGINEAAKSGTDDEEEEMAASGSGSSRSTGKSRAGNGRGR